MIFHFRTSCTYARESLSFFMTDDSMTLKTINSSRTAYTRAVREEFQETAVIVSSVITFLYLNIELLHIMLQRYKIFKANPNFSRKKCCSKTALRQFCWNKNQNNPNCWTTPFLSFMAMLCLCLGLFDFNKVWKTFLFPIATEHGFRLDYKCF